MGVVWPHDGQSQPARQRDMALTQDASRASREGPGTEGHTGPHILQVSPPGSPGDRGESRDRRGQHRAVGCGGAGMFSN